MIRDSLETHDIVEEGKVDKTFQIAILLSFFRCIKQQG